MKRLYILMVVLSIVAITCACSNSNQTVDSQETGISVEAEPPDSISEPIIEPTPEITTEPTQEPTPEPIAIDYEILRPNEIGQIMIIMYHQVLPESDNVYKRTIDDFKNDLQKLYDMGFRTISMSDLINNNVVIEAGMTPVVLTFDDGYSSAFSLVATDNGLVPVEDCVVDIMNKFADDHPDFGRNAMFYINNEPFKGDGTLAERLGYLIDNGYEIGSHTYSHAKLGSLNEDEILKEIGSLHNIILENIGYEMKSLSYPYGERPVEGLRGLALFGEYEGVAYEYHSAVRVGLSGGSAAPNHVDFDPSNLPRVQGSDIENTDLGWFLRNYENGTGGRYISDGMPDRISVPESVKNNINMDSLGNKELYIY